MNYTYILTEEGTLLVLQVLRCNSCGSIGAAYINMAYVESGIVIGGLCPICQEETLEVVTYSFMRDEE